MFKREEKSSEDERFGEVWEILNSEILTDGTFRQAQEALDSVRERDAEWHYVQAAIFYERSWYLDCKKQLRKARKLAPENTKYKEAFEELVAMADEAKKGGKPMPAMKEENAQGCVQACCELTGDCVCCGF